MFIKSGFTFLVFFFNFNFVVAQREVPKEDLDWNRFFLGGNLGGVSLSSQGSFIDVSPMIGYRFKNNFSAGVGFIYQYYSFPVDLVTRIEKVRAHNYGVKVFGRYLIWRGLFVHAEYEVVNRKIFTVTSTGQILEERRWVGSKFVGGGYQQVLGGSTNLFLMALYNLNQTDYSPRSSPIYFNMGIGFGL